MENTSSGPEAHTTDTSAVPKPFSPLQSSDGTSVVTRDWSWGAFMLGPYFLIAVRKYVYLWLYALMLVPLVNIVAWLGIMIFLGIKGTEMTHTSHTFTSDDQREGFLRAIDHGGKIMFIVSLVGIVLWFLFMGLFFDTLLKKNIYF